MAASALARAHAVLPNSSRQRYGTASGTHALGPRAVHPPQALARFPRRRSCLFITFAHHPSNNRVVASRAEEDAFGGSSSSSAVGTETFGNGSISDHLERRKKRQAEAAAAAGGPPLGELETVEWPLGDGGEHVVKILVPKAKASDDERARLYNNDGELAGLFSRLIWPSGQALARLLATSPRLVRGRDVIELGCGLGLPSCAAAASGAARVLCVDVDAGVAATAAQSAALNVPSSIKKGKKGIKDKGGGEGAEGAGGAADVISGASLDWNKPGEWPSAAFDVAVGADILYSDEFPAPIAAILAAVLRPEAGADGAPCALIADPKHRTNRGAFAQACASHGLDTAESDMPSDASITLITVSRRQGSSSGDVTPQKRRR